MKDMEFIELDETPIIAVLVIDEVEDAVPVAESLVAGGVKAIELTLRTPAALKCIEAISKNVGDIKVGAGTVIFKEQVREVRDAGAEFAVSPGLNPDIVRTAKEIGLPFAPGIATPSDIETALHLGCITLKFFPAEPSGGMAYLKSMSAPYNYLNISYVPLGGIGPGNMQEYLVNSFVPAIGGSWLAKRDVIAAKEWKTIERNAAEAMRLAVEAKGGKE
jgi:2-dehydro-3-deoxyphosphogluconate aldolase / (4S)-4-hydroxy-2-oxoglutarate aldolase